MSLRKYASGKVLEEEEDVKVAAKQRPQTWTPKDSAELKEENSK